MSESEHHTDVPAAPRWRPLRGPFQRWPRTSDFLLAFYAFWMTLMIWSPLSAGQETPTGDWRSPATFIIVLVGSGALYWRRSKPVVVHLMIVAASGLVLLLGEMNNNLFAMLFSLYSLGRYADDDRASIVGVSASLALIFVDLLLLNTTDTPGVSAAIIVMGLWYLGRRLRFRGEYLRLMEERSKHLERQRTVEAERAVAEERTRIARELHDVVAHQVSLMTVQAGAAKTVVREQPDAAAEAMGLVERAGRQALNELRHVLGVLRPDESSSPLAPQPGTADVPRLVEDLKKAGLDVTMSIEGVDSGLTARVDLAIYRIVQESLTNVLKHAGPGTAVRITIRADTRGVTLEVQDNGRAETRLPGSGLGIAGMRERAQVLRGSLEAGPAPEGGFRVRAYLPNAA